MRILAVFISFLLLSGCAGSVIGDRLAGPEKLAQQDDAYCSSIGLKLGTADYANCRLQMSQRRENRAQAASDAMIATGLAISAGSQ